MKVNKVTTVDVNDVKLDPANPNVMDQDEMDRLRKSMDTYGFLTPLVLDQNNMLVDGEHRFTVFKEYNIKEIPCIKLKFNSEAERRTLRQVMNKLSGTHDIEKDLKELEIIMENDAQMLEELTGITEKEIEDMRAELSDEPHFQMPKSDFEPDEQEEKHVLHIPVSDGLLSKIKFIMKKKDIDDYEELLEWLSSQVNIT